MSAGNDVARAGKFNSGIDRLSVQLGLVASADVPESQRELAYLRDVLGLHHGMRVTDAPCGTGRHALGLARAGYGVTAIDADPEALVEARRIAAHPSIDYRLADLAGPRVLPDGSQDAIVSLYSCIGYGCTPERDQAMLQNFRAAMRPGATLVLGTANRDVVLSGDDSQVEFRHGGHAILRRDRPDPQAGLLDRHFTVVYADGRRLELSETRRLYSPRELSIMFAKAGLALVACHGDFASRTCDPACDPHLLYVCRTSSV
ncbi:class I SAM-dependent methyltransferase [Mesorhizobium sp.]|uniref:class I SAM-dependent methyltransferase n=1 Tax=Mesorhizobium sp. TaxID=1871066 RepID=UPI000FE47365|nr:class I SAM-dependent methyltransferase [Mesorhizobium sp.]RWB31646.1 MAG: class I SAM-dependent methyltransferase [Mesorhizobium sp.]